MLRRVLRNFILFSSGQILSQGIMFVALIYLARVIGPEGLGKIGFAQVFTTYFICLMDMGLGLLGVREIAKDSNKIPDYVNTILSIRIVLSVLYFILLTGITLFIDKPVDLKVLILMYGLVIFSFAAALDWFFLGAERVGLIGIVNSFRALTFLVLIFFFVKGGEDIFKVAAFFFTSFLLSTLLYFAFAKKYFSYSLKFQIDFSKWKVLIRQALPLGILGIFTIFIQQQSVLVLGFYSTPEEVGFYYGIYKIVFIAIFVIGLYGDTLYPIFSNTKGRRILFFSLKLIFLLSIPVIILSTLFDREIITLVLGEKFIDGAACFKILLWSLPLSALIAVFSKLMLARKLDWEYLMANILGFLASIIASLYLIPLYGLIGAAISYVISLAVATTYTGYYALKIVRYSEEEIGLDTKEIIMSVSS